MTNSFKDTTMHKTCREGLSKDESRKRNPWVECRDYFIKEYFNKKYIH